MSLRINGAELGLNVLLPSHTGTLPPEYVGMRMLQQAILHSNNFTGNQMRGPENFLHLESAGVITMPERVP